MPLRKVQFAPGFNKQASDSGAENQWVDGDFVRFRYGMPEKIGGWSEIMDKKLVGATRASHSWADLDGRRYIAFGTNKLLYVYDGDDYHDDGVEQQQLSLRDPSVVAAYHDCPFRVHATLSYTFLSIIRVGLCDFVLPRHPDITQGQYVAVYSKSAGCVVRGVFQRLFRYREAPLRI